ncbi:dipeptidyl-peptidase [Pseudoxanthomonas spadix BD-a59]|uniref:Dipeptidyl-peptidase n=1 Tax=Pseudoxanthomonas spadix (strain BD-a59) TaxID=1045855 RepID=G7US77_PSEUP|nr:S9 family peptidase [Pseudoxanthomonas spadix]AER54746.1 dipeptidyl-peptidase [Pseudoxanthomonas spadix BD-a59]
MRLSAAVLSCLMLSPAAFAQAPASTPLTIEQVMADLDWIGPPVEDARWTWDSRAVEYALKRNGSPIRDTFRQELSASAATRVADDARHTLGAPGAVFDGKRQHQAFVRNGDVFVRNLRSGALTQLTRTLEEETAPQFGSDGALVWRVGNQWWHWNGTSVAQAAQARAEDDPDKPKSEDLLREQQLRTLSTLAHDRDMRQALRRQEDRWRKADPSRAPAPVYLGSKVQIEQTALSPDGQWLLIVTQEKGAEAGRAGKVAHYVTESGYAEDQEARTLVGRNSPVPQALWLADMRTGTAKPLSFDALPGITSDPLAGLRKAAGKEPIKGNRAVRVESDGDGSGAAIQWSADSRNVAVLLRATDNKDRWIAGVDLANARLQVRDRLTDPGWINWSFNEFGWLADNETLWLLSEASGYSQLYTQRGTERPRALTSGQWEASAPVPAADGDRFYFLCNRTAPGRYEVCQVDLKTGKVAEVTALDGGVEGFSQSPDGRWLLVQYSASYLPTQLAVVPANGGAARVLTDTRTAAYKAQPWIQPQLVQVPSRHGAGTVWGKYYGPARTVPGKRYPIVMFVHGAGYLQNAIAGYPPYPREQMFHNLLVQQGYLVLDLDYRGSAGYGRAWRTAIYRNMGHPELDDYLDGLDWLIAHHQGDRDRAGIYGGSYGGFMTYMALFRAPGVFKAGAALRPVADWTQYNHQYTSNILNTPDLDPQAYRISSPIEYADGLQDRLLIAHGMIDDNVFFKDSVDMAQKLIELHKDNWSLAPYPLERHSFTRADSWLDEYKRVLDLFNDALKPAP